MGLQERFPAKQREERYKSSEVTGQMVGTWYLPGHSPPAAAAGCFSTELFSWEIYWI